MSHAALVELSRTSPTQALATGLGILRQQYNDSLYDLAKYGLGYNQLTLFTHGEMVQVLESDRKRKLVVMPRNTFKSTIGVVAYAIWRIRRNPNIRILIDSETFQNSKNFMREIKAHLTGSLLTGLDGVYRGAPLCGGPELWNESELIIRQRTVARKEATITCGGIGVVKVGQHYDLIIGDDYNSRKNSMTPEARAKVVNHYKMNTAILDPEGEYVIIGTRYAADDVIGHILVNEIGLDENGDPVGRPSEEQDKARGLL